MKRSKAKSRILEAVHETASDLHRLGLIDKRKVRKFDALCLDPIPQEKIGGVTFPQAKPSC